MVSVSEYQQQIEKAKQQTQQASPQFTQQQLRQTTFQQRQQASSGFEEQKQQILEKIQSAETDLKSQLEKILSQKQPLTVEKLKAMGF